MENGTDSNNSTDFYAAIYADGINRFNFVAICVVIVTLGSFLLWTLTQLIRENQFSNIQELLLAHACSIVLVSNAVFSVVISVR